MSAESEYKCTKCGHEWSAIPPSTCMFCAAGEKPPMKKLSDEVSLVGKLEVVTISELRNNPGEILAMAELGKTYIITRKGKQVLVLSRVPGVQLSMAVDSNGSATWVTKSNDDRTK
jgi:prevent-host-death family protein